MSKLSCRVIMFLFTASQYCVYCFKYKYLLCVRIHEWGKELTSRRSNNAVAGPEHLVKVTFPLLCLNGGEREPSDSSRLTTILYAEAASFQIGGVNILVLSWPNDHLWLIFDGWENVFITPSLRKNGNVSVSVRPQICLLRCSLVCELLMERRPLDLKVVYVVPFQVLQLRPKTGVRGLHKSLTDVALEHHEECDCVCRGNAGG